MTPAYVWSVTEPPATYATDPCDDWAGAIKHLRPQLYRMAQSIVKNTHDAEDAVQDALLRAWEHRHRLRDDRARHGWLLSIVRHVSIDCLRRRSTILRVIPTEFDEGVSDVCSGAIRFARPGSRMEIQEVIGRLSAPHRRAIDITVEGSGLTELAEREGIGYGAAKARLSRARARLHASL